MLEYYPMLEYFPVLVYTKMSLREQRLRIHKTSHNNQPKCFLRSGGNGFQHQSCRHHPENKKMVQMELTGIFSCNIFTKYAPKTPPPINGFMGIDMFLSVLPFLKHHEHIHITIFTPAARLATSWDHNRKYTSYSPTVQ